MYSPVPVAVIFLVYLCVVWVGPRLMKHREPVDLKAVLIVYNFAMVVLSAYMFHEVRLRCLQFSFSSTSQMSREHCRDDPGLKNTVVVSTYNFMLFLI